MLKVPSLRELSELAARELWTIVRHHYFGHSMTRKLWPHRSHTSFAYSNLVASARRNWRNSRPTVGSAARHRQHQHLPKVCLERYGLFALFSSMHVAHTALNKLRYKLPTTQWKITPYIWVMITFFAKRWDWKVLHRHPVTPASCHSKNQASSYGSKVFLQHLQWLGRAMAPIQIHVVNITILNSMA